MCEASPQQPSLCTSHCREATDSGWASAPSLALQPEGYTHVQQKGFLPRQALHRELSQAFDFTWMCPHESLSSVFPPRLEALRGLSITVPQHLAPNSIWATSKGEKEQPRGGGTHVLLFPLQTRLSSQLHASGITRPASWTRGMRLSGP